MRPVNLAAARRRLHFQVNGDRAWRRLPVPNWLPAACAGVAFATLVLSFEDAFRRYAAAGLTEAQLTLGFSAENLVISGARRTAEPSILEACGVSPGAPILELDVHAARARLEALPWVAEATVRRRLPDTLIVDVKEHAPKAIWLRPDGPELVSPTGASIPAESLGAYAGLPRLVGDDAPQEAPKLLAELDNIAAIKSRLRRLEHMPSGRWRLHLTNGIVVELPLEAPLPPLRQLADLHAAEGLFDKALDRIDLRLAGAVVLAPMVVPAPGETRG